MADPDDEKPDKARQTTSLDASHRAKHAITAEEGRGSAQGCAQLWGKTLEATRAPLLNPRSPEAHGGEANGEAEARL